MDLEAITCDNCMVLNIINANVRKHVKPRVCLVKDIQKFNLDSIDIFAHPHNVHHLFLYDLQRIVGWLYFYHRVLCGMLFSLLFTSHHLRYLDPRCTILENAWTLLHEELAYLHCGDEWVYHFSILEGYPLGWHYFRQFSWSSSC